MATYKVFMGLGAGIAIVGFLVITITGLFDSSARTTGDLAVRALVVLVGLGLYKLGEHMRDGR